MKMSFEKEMDMVQSQIMKTSSIFNMKMQSQMTEKDREMNKIFAKVSSMS